MGKHKKRHRKKTKDYNFIFILLLGIILGILIPFWGWIILASVIIVYLASNKINIPYFQGGNLMKIIVIKLPKLFSKFVRIFYKR